MKPAQIALGGALAATLLAPSAGSERQLATGDITDAGFRTLMMTVAAGWNDGDARRSAECFAEDAIYSEPPRKQFYKGREALFEFFGGNRRRERPMRMTWHHLVFDERTQVGSGEYTFQQNNRYHGVAMVKIRDGRIANWREYQYQSALSWEEFINENAF